VNTTRRASRLAALTTLTLAGLALALAGCDRSSVPKGDLPPAYTSNRITDPALGEVSNEIHAWAVERTGAEGKPLYEKVEVLPPAPIVQPYGVGVFQQEMRLPVILTTGPGWDGLTAAEKEDAVASAFREFSDRLLVVKREPPLRPTLTVQTPEGLELSWINHLDPTEKNVHGDD